MCVCKVKKKHRELLYERGMEGCMRVIVSVLCRSKDHSKMGVGNHRFMNQLFDVLGQWAREYEIEKRALYNKGEMRM
jgi:hypothetical protein